MAAASVPRMPSSEHDGANALIREQPILAPRLLQEAGGISLPTGPLPRVESGELHDRVSTIYQADTIVADGPPQDPWYSVITEIETALTPQKIQQTVKYAVTRWLQLHCKPVYVLIISPDPRAGQYAGPVTVRSGSLLITLEVVIAGPDRIPVFTRAEHFSSDPAVLPLVIMAHCDKPGVQEGFIELLKSIDDEDDRVRLFEYALSACSGKKRRDMEAMVSSTAFPIFSEMGRKQFGRGKAEGTAEGEAKAVLAVLEERGMTVTQEQRARIEGTTDPELLLTWIRRAVTTPSTAELLDGPAG